jgi:hypothetical protein
VGCHVGGVQLLGAAGPEALAGVVRVPDVEVALTGRVVSAVFFFSSMDSHEACIGSKLVLPMARPG